MIDYRWQTPSISEWAMRLALALTHVAHARLLDCLEGLVMD